MAITVNQLHPRFFGEIVGADLMAEPTEELRGAVEAAMEKHAVCVVRQGPISDEAHIRFGRLFGPLELPPGYATREHSHPYVEILTVLSGKGEAWLDGEAGTTPMAPGVTISIPAGRVHGFRALGDEPLVTYGIHTFPKRVVHYKDPPQS